MPADPKLARTPRRDPGSLLKSQLQQFFGGRGRVVAGRERPWASITFSGTRYSFTVHGADAQDRALFRRLARALPEHEFAVPGYFVADILVSEENSGRLRIELLSIIDPVKTSESGAA